MNPDVWNYVAAALVFIIVFRSIRKIQKNAKNNACGGNCAGCQLNCPSKINQEDKNKK